MCTSERCQRWHYDRLLEVTASLSLCNQVEEISRPKKWTCGVTSHGTIYGNVEEHCGSCGALGPEKLTWRSAWDLQGEVLGEKPNPRRGLGMVVSIIQVLRKETRTIGND